MKFEFLKSHPDLPGTNELKCAGGNKSVNTLAADALASYMARSSAAMVLSVQDKHGPVVHEERLQLPAPYQWWEIKWNLNMFAKSKFTGYISTV